MSYAIISVGGKQYRVREGERLLVDRVVGIEDGATFTPSVLLVGGDGAWQVLAREPMLRSRIYRRVVCTPLSGAQVCALLPRYHRIYAGVAADLLLFVDDHFAHGNLRDWAAFTATAVELCQGTGAEQLDEQVARNAFALHGGVRSRPAASSAS